MRKRLFLVLTLALALVAMPVLAQRTFLTIATGGLAGVYYPLGGGMARLISDNITGVQVSVTSTGASLVNVGLLAQRDVELALIQNDIAYYAANGLEMFAGRQTPNLRGIAVLYPETIQIITLANSGINRVEDLRGKRVAVGAHGSGTEANARQILAAHGLTYQDLRSTDYLSFAEAASNLRDRNVDAAFVTAGFPTAAVTDIATSHNIKVISISTQAYEKLVADYPFYTQICIPKETYRNQAEDVQSVAVMAMLTTHQAVSDDLIYGATKAIFDNLATLATYHSAGARISVEKALEGQPLILHPGAARYFGQ